MITRNMVKTGYEQGLVELVDSPNMDGVVCRIKSNWFYFGGQEAGRETAESYTKRVPKETIVSKIFTVLLDFREELPDEYTYYLEALQTA